MLGPSLKILQNGRYLVTKYLDFSAMPCVYKRHIRLKLEWYCYIWAGTSGSSISSLVRYQEFMWLFFVMNYFPSWTSQRWTSISHIYRSFSNQMFRRATFFQSRTSQLESFISCTQGRHTRPQVGIVARVNALDMSCGHFSFFSFNNPGIFVLQTILSNPCESRKKN